MPAADNPYYPKPGMPKGIKNVASVHLGSLRSFAVRTDGSLWVWGHADLGARGVLGRHLRVPTLLELP